jgi:hypothetical protein
LTKKYRISAVCRTFIQLQVLKTRWRADAVWNSSVYDAVNRPFGNFLIAGKP